MRLWITWEEDVDAPFTRHVALLRGPYCRGRVAAANSWGPASMNLFVGLIVAPSRSAGLQL